ncbi:hypothetical protein H9P43_001348 [Blastocladiella emersonii ATCC 22665]|nr:hypothetical protein H9P43_001348 [Blastocladiella emersonii ATCC 22665]
MGQVTSQTLERARAALPLIPRPGGAPGAPATGGQQQQQQQERIDSGLWSGNSMYFGPHFVLRYPAPRGAVATAGPTPGEGQIINTQLAAAAAGVTGDTAMAAAAGVTPEMIAAWRAGRGELTAAPGEFHVLCTTLQCLVNVKRASILLEALPAAQDLGAAEGTDPQSPGSRHSIKFTLDSVIPCVVKVMMVVQELDGKVLNPMAGAHFSHPLVTVPLPAGLGQTFDLAAHYPAGFDLGELMQCYSNAVATVSPLPPPPSSPTSPTSTAASPRSASPTTAAEAPAPVPVYHIAVTVSADPSYPLVTGGADPATLATEQWTFLAVDPRDREVRVVKQKMWLPGVSGTAPTSFLLQEIYGFTETAPSGSPIAATDDAAGSGQQPECIVCMADPKDTMVLPCRHLCLCKDCAQQLRKQSDKCPMCRQPYHSMLHIARPPEGGAAADKEIDGDGKPGSSAAAGAPPVLRTAAM